MKLKIFSAINVGLITLCLLPTRTSHWGIIRLMYTGDYSKPYPVVILHLPGIIDTAKIDAWKLEYEINETGFEEIRKSVEQRSIIPMDGMLLASYRIEVCTNGETWILLTQYLSRIRQIFDTVLNQLDESKKTEAKAKFAELLERLAKTN